MLNGLATTIARLVGGDCSPFIVTHLDDPTTGRQDAVRQDRNGVAMFVFILMLGR